MRIKRKISKSLIVRFPSVVDRHLNHYRKVDGSIPLQGYFFLYHFYFQCDCNLLARAFLLTIFLMQAC